VRLAGDTWGKGRGPLVVLQHGGGQMRHAWKRTGERLAAAGFRAVAFDARGHGDSDWAADGDYSHDSMVADLRGVLSALGEAHPVLVGASMGGNTSLLAVGEGQVDARALVLVDVAPDIEAKGVRRIHDFMSQNPNGFHSLEEVAHAIKAYQPHRRRSANLDGLAKNVRMGHDGRYRWHWDPRFRDARETPEERRQRLEQSARALKIPTLLVRGALSDVLTEDGVRAFKALCPHAEYVQVADAAHMVAGDRNDPFGDAIIRFVTEVVGRSATDSSVPGAVPSGDVGVAR
jgi:pimeloyl-ACP methyl ester carboxylesterase